jgi:ABC-type proline/glycine betaine transport system, ATPase component
MIDGPTDAGIVRIDRVSKVFGPVEARIRRRTRICGDFGQALAHENAVAALKDVSLVIAKGEIFAIMGLSGSGKSTLVRCINGLIAPTAGQIWVEGTAVCGASAREMRALRQQRMAMVFQSFALLPHMSVGENVAFGLMLRGESTGARRSRVDEVLEMVGLASWRDRRIHELSGGMKQRVGLARALAPDPDILIMDEPFSALDPLIRASLQDELLRLQRELKKTILFVTHDFDEATRIGNRILIMKDGQAVQVGTPTQLIGRPADAYVQAFIARADRLAFLTIDALTEAIPCSTDESRAQEPGDSVLQIAPHALMIDILASLRDHSHVATTCSRSGRPRLIPSRQIVQFVGGLYSAQRDR